MLVFYSTDVREEQYCRAISSGTNVIDSAVVSQLHIPTVQVVFTKESIESSNRCAFSGLLKHYPGTFNPLKLRECNVYIQHPR